MKYFLIHVLSGCYLIYLGYLALTPKVPANERFTPKAEGNFKIFLNGF
jgi:threonine/homoserine/homoserine lactone efflux protein